MNAKEYASCNDVQKQHVLNLIDEFEEDIAQMSGKCMDIGCGPGDITKNILLPALNSNAVIIGTDISENMIKFAKKTYSNEKQLKFEVLDIQTKNLPEKYISEFDHIFSFHTLHWCYDIRQAFENIFQMIRPGGNILMLIVASHDAYEIMKFLAQDIRFAPYIQDVKNYVPPFNDLITPHKKLRKLLKSIGFDVCHCSLREVTYSSQNMQNFLYSILAIYPFLDKLPHDQKEEFRNEFTREFMKRKLTCKTIQNNQEQTNFIDLYKILIVYARKIV
ncbi:juvenile hormone acid O-methyltransferase-like [Camponotus floridanus]|uniref:juvenile hormone acid O-methyltransferase-like n=1 Tax=Camponotus floridanus TaxID=104421 RepID=UPI000DC6BEF4|nr:juvenile hormone acid O-methyltransferase-like [Camponotus floridanus]